MNPITPQQAANAELKRRKARKAGLKSTVSLGKITGSNAHEPISGKYPWVECHEDIAEFFDRPIPDMGLPIKPVAMSRGHLKTEIGVHALVRHVLRYPEHRNCIIGAAHDRSQKNLGHINSMLQSKSIQPLYGPTTDGPLFPEGHDAYTKDSLMVKRTGDYREKTIETFGRNANIAGRHYNGVIWLDDIVTEQDDFEGNPRISENILELLTHIIEAVADPGCEIWLTFTRYHPADPYARIMESDAYDSMIVKGRDGGKGIVRDCYAAGGKAAIYPFRHCMEKEDEVADVTFRGRTYKKVRRRSLVEMENRVKPEWWYSQMLNRPMVGSSVGFKKEHFDRVLPVEGDGLDDWVQSGQAQKALGLNCRGPLITHILGDPSYRGGRSNDYAVLWVVAQTINNHFVVLDGFRARLGYQGDKEYARLALGFKERYNARELAIEKHAKESIETVFQMIAAEEGKRVSFFPLKDNSNVNKKDRIATLIPITTEGRLHFCSNVDHERLNLQREASMFPACCDGGHNMHDDCLDALANMTQVFNPRKIDGRNTDAFNWRNNVPKNIRRIIGRRRVRW